MELDWRQKVRKRMPNYLTKFSYSLAFTDRLDIDPAVAGGGFHDGIQHKLAFEAVVEGRLHRCVAGDGIDEVGRLVAEGVLVTDGAARHPPVPHIRMDLFPN